MALPMNFQLFIDTNTVACRIAISSGFLFSGDYVNVDTMESWSMDHAIKEGLVKAKPIPANDTVSFSISAVVDPKTGEWCD